MTSSEHEVYYLHHDGGGYNYGVPSSEVTGGHLQVTPKQKKKRTGTSRIKVCVRKRPLNKREEKQERDVVDVDEDKHQLLVKEEKLAVDLRKVLLVHKFQFDEVFGDNVSNKGVYERTAKHFLPFVLKGGKATCFAFGQTGAGKTHTLLGDKNGKGLYQYAAEDLFECLRAEAECDGVVVWISYFEIYCGQLYDLLNKRERIQALENGKHQVCITGVNEVPVNGPQALNQFIELGNSVRSQGSSGVNSSSSRSHAVLQIQLKDVTGNRLGRLSFIDLAGSERACDRGEPDKTTRLEGAEINTSLLALKECIRAMDQEHSYTPFRQSKLTQVLRDSFLGPSLTCMVASISPGSSSLEHTLNTLRYADRVKEIHKLANNSHQFSSTPKSFMPSNTSTPLKTPKNLKTSPLNPRRTSLPVSNLHTSTPDTKRRSSVQARSPRLHRTVGDHSGSEVKGSPRRKVKQQGTTVNVSAGGEEMDKNCQQDDQHHDESKGRNLLQLSPAVHREVVDGEAVKLRSNILRNSQHQEKDDRATSNVTKEMKAAYMNGDGRKSSEEKILREKEAGEENGSFDGELDKEQDEKIRRKKMVKSFLSNSLPVWEDEKVIEKVTPSPNLSIGWEIENPHFIETRKSTTMEGEEGEREINNNSDKFDVMTFENARYVGQKSKIQIEVFGVDEKFDKVRNVGSHQSFQSLTDHFAKEVTSYNGSKGVSSSPGLDQGGGEREGAGSPRSIATDSTMELLAEIDQSLRNSSVSPVPDLARRYTLDGMSHDGFWKDINNLKSSLLLTEKVKKVTLSTEYQKSITKTKVKGSEGSALYHNSDISRKVGAELEQKKRGSSSRENLQRKATESSKDKTEVRKVSGKEPDGEFADVERNDRRLGEEGKGGASKRPHQEEAERRKSSNRQERKDTRRRTQEKGEMKEGYSRVSKDTVWESKQTHVGEERNASINQQPRKGSLNPSTSDQHQAYSYLHQCGSTRDASESTQHHKYSHLYQHDSLSNEGVTSSFSLPISKTDTFERNATDKVRGRLGRNVDKSATSEMMGVSGDAPLNGYGRECSSEHHPSHYEGMEIDRRHHRSHRVPDGNTMLQDTAGMTEDEAVRISVNKNSKRHGMNMGGNIENDIWNNGEGEVMDEEGSGSNRGRNTPQNHKVKKTKGGSSKVDKFRDIPAENGKEKKVAGELSGRCHSQPDGQCKEEASNQSLNRNNFTKYERSKEPANKNINKVELPISRTAQNDDETEGSVLSVIQGSRFSDKMDLDGKVVSVSNKDLNLSHSKHNTGEWCECCSVLEQKQLWNREGAVKQEERFGLKEERLMDHHRRASLNQGSESPSRRRRNLKQRNSLPWLGAPTFTSQEDFIGRVGDTESGEHVMRRGLHDGEVGTKDNKQSAKVFTSRLTIQCTSKPSEVAKVTNVVSTSERQQVSDEKGRLTEGSVEPGDGTCLRDHERHVTFDEDVCKRGMESREQYHHPHPSALVTPDDKYKRSPTSVGKEKPSSPDLTVYSTGGYIPTVFAVAQNNTSMTPLNNSVGKSGKKKKSLKEKLSEKGIESLPSPKGFPLKTDKVTPFEEDSTNNEQSHSETSSHSKAITTWAEFAGKHQRSDDKEKTRESFFLWDVESENSVPFGPQGSEPGHQQVAFYRETYQRLSNQWQHVRNDGRSPVVKVKLSARGDGRDSEKEQETSGVLTDRSNFGEETGINKSYMNRVTDEDQKKIGDDLMTQENEWEMQSRVRLEEIGNSGNGVTNKMKQSEAVVNHVQKEQRNRDESLIHHGFDNVEEKKAQSKRTRECEGRSKFIERDEVSSERKEEESLKGEGEESGLKEMTDDVTEADAADMKMSHGGSKLSESNALMIEDANNSMQQMTGVASLEVESSWVGHQPLSPIPETRSDEDDDENLRGRLTNGTKEESQGDFIRPNSALEKATEHSNLFSRNLVPKDRHLLVRAHQEQLEELQQLCDSGWNLINKLQLGQGDVYEYLSDSDILLDSQERCIQTFKDQLAMYTSCSSPAVEMVNGKVEHTNGRL